MISQLMFFSLDDYGPGYVVIDRIIHTHIGVEGGLKVLEDLRLRLLLDRRRGLHHVVPSY